MRSQTSPAARARRTRARRVGVGIGLGSLALLLTGCTREQWEVGFLPTESKGATDHTDNIIALWNGGWIAALLVGILTWALILWCIIAYRRKKTDTGLPVQLRYNMPLEILYTAVPLILVMAFFFQTVRVQTSIDTPKEADTVVEIAGKQWSWDFNYVTDDVYSAGVQSNLDGTTPPGEEAPTLYLPEGEQLEIRLRSRDVIHSFWVPAFLQKRDMIPGRETSIYLKPQKTGEYVGKCAELCGEFHSEMLFNVKVVSPAEYEAYIESLRDEGNTGQLGPEYDRNPGFVEDEGTKE